ncbi:MAG: hypothetical protein EOP37_22530 [Rubrivivax sp.]|nr:MAG: hypothetical protein EOP37_22530 [Rubrivivax sp.]
MAANQLLHGWQCAEARCIAADRAVRAVRARLQAGRPISNEDLLRLGALSTQASAAYDRYRSGLTEQIQANAGWMSAGSQVVPSNDETAARREVPGSFRDDVDDAARHTGNDFRHSRFVGHANYLDGLDVGAEGRARSELQPGRYR